MIKLKNARIFSAFEDVNNVAFFHVTHNNVIDEEDIDNLNGLLVNYSYKMLKDLYCDYSLTFVIYR